MIVMTHFSAESGRFYSTLKNNKNRFHVDSIDEFN